MPSEGQPVSIAKDQPTCWIIAEPNGAGKTTFALDYLPNVAGCRHYLNADLIASGIAPPDPGRAALTAGRLFLREISQRIDERLDFVFETTLSGLTYQPLIERLKDENWRVERIYLMLPSVEVAIRRVAERASSGGHDIPKNVIERRFYRSALNLLNVYAKMVDKAICLYSINDEQILVFSQQNGKLLVSSRRLFDHLAPISST